MSIGYYIGFHGVSLTMSFSIEIYDLSRFLAQHPYLNLVLTQKLK